LRNVRRYLFVIVSLIASIAQADPQSVESAPNFEWTKDSGATQAQCLQQLANTSVGKQVLTEILYTTDNIQKQQELSAIDSKLTAQQKEVLKEYIAKNLDCRSIAFERQLTEKGVITRQKFYEEMDAVFDQLLEGEITIGQANKLKAKAVEQFQKNNYSPEKQKNNPILINAG